MFNNYSPSSYHANTDALFSVLDVAFHSASLVVFCIDGKAYVWTGPHTTKDEQQLVEARILLKLEKYFKTPATVTRADNEQIRKAVERKFNARNAITLVKAEVVTSNRWMARIWAVSEQLVL